MSKNPQSVRAIVTLMALYLHVGPYSRHVIEQIDLQIEDLRQGRVVAPKVLPPTEPETIAVGADDGPRASASAARQEWV